MDADAQGLTLESLERALRRMVEDMDTRMHLKPTKLWVHPMHRREAMRLLGWLKGPIRKTKGTRARKRALYWRTTK